MYPSQGNFYQPNPPAPYGYPPASGQFYPGQQPPMPGVGSQYNQAVGFNISDNAGFGFPGIPQPYSSQPYPVQQYTGQQYPGQQYPSQPYPNQSYANQGMPAAAYGQNPGYPPCQEYNQASVPFGAGAAGYAALNQPSQYQQQPYGYSNQAPPVPSAPPSDNRQHNFAMGATALSAASYQNVQSAQGTVRYFPGFNAEADAQIMRKAMKGLGTDEKAIINVITQRCNAQRQEMRLKFKTMYGKDLLKEMRSELGGDLEKVILALMEKPIDYDVKCLHKAMKGAGTDENVLTEILTTRSNREIEQIKTVYHSTFGRNLERDVASETSGYYKRLLISCLQCGRYENPQLNIELARKEAHELYNAGERKIGTDESVFIRVLAIRNAAQLRATFQEYQKLSGKTIFQAISSEMSGDLADGMKALAMAQVDQPAYFAGRLHKYLAGLGTQDDGLIRIIVSRSEIDLQNIKHAYQTHYAKPLQTAVRSDTSGDYRTTLLAVIGH